jgi:hypothetical protein
MDYLVGLLVNLFLPHAVYLQLSIALVFEDRGHPLCFIGPFLLVFEPSWAQFDLLDQASPASDVDLSRFVLSYLDVLDEASLAVPLRLKQLHCTVVAKYDLDCRVEHRK